MNRLQQNPNSHHVVPSQQKRTKTAKKFTRKDFLQIHTSSVWLRERHTQTEIHHRSQTERERERERNGNLGIDTLLLYLLVRRKEKSGGKGTRGACCGGKKNKSKSKEQEQIVSFKWDCGYSTWRSMSPSTELITRTRWTAWSMCYASGPFCFPACSCWPTPSSWCRSCHGCPAAYNCPPPSPSSSSTASWCSTTASWLR